MKINLKDNYYSIFEVLMITSMVLMSSYPAMNTLFEVLKPIYIITAIFGISLILLSLVLVNFVKASDIEKVKNNIVSPKIKRFIYLLLEIIIFGVSIYVGEKFIALLILIRFILMEIFKSVVLDKFIEIGDTNEKA